VEVVAGTDGEGLPTLYVGLWSVAVAVGQMPTILVLSSVGAEMPAEIDELTELAYEGSGVPLTTTPVAGSPSREYAPLLTPGSEPVAVDEIRVTILGSGDPAARPARRVGRRPHDRLRPS